MLKASKELISAAGNSLGLKPNKLAAIFNLPEESKTISMGNEWNEVLPTILNPLNVATVVTLIDGSLDFYTAASDDTRAVLCGSAGDVYGVLPLSLPELALEFIEKLGYTPSDVPAVGMSLSYDALITLLCAADHIKRSKLEAMLDPGKDLFAMSPEILATLFSGFNKSGDIRWLSTLAAWISSDISVDFKKGADELISGGLLTWDGVSLETEGDSPLLFGELSKAESVLAITSMFYADGKLYSQPRLFVHSPHFLWSFDFGKEGSFASVNSEQAMILIAEALAPGGEVPADAPQPAAPPAAPPVTPPVVAPPAAPPAASPPPQPTAPQQSSARWVCSACGRTNTGNFCKGCGKPQSAGHALQSAPPPPVQRPAPPAPPGNRCPACGNAIAPGARFCKKCGAKME